MQQHLMQMQPIMAAYYPNNVTTDHIQQVLYFLPSSILQPFSFFFFFIFTLLSFYFPSRSFMSLLRGTFFLRLWLLFQFLPHLYLCFIYFPSFPSSSPLTLQPMATAITTMVWYHIVFSLLISLSTARFNSC